MCVTPNPIPYSKPLANTATMATPTHNHRVPLGDPRNQLAAISVIAMYGTMAHIPPMLVMIAVVIIDFRAGAMSFFTPGSNMSHPLTSRVYRCIR